jgi:hypothetical protein
MARGSARGLAMFVVGLALVGCGGGHSHASTPAATGGQVATGAGGQPAQPVINGPATTGQGAAVGSSGSSSTGGQRSSQVIGFPVGPLLPTTVDKGQCQAARFADKSVYAQIAVAHATCAQVPTVAAGADLARGESYSAAGFACVATAPQPSNGYWISEYVSYSCRNGDDQIAFNWGTSSSAF